MSVGLLEKDPLGHPLVPHKKVPVRKFLNRLLGLRLRDQQLFWEYFALFLDKVRFKFVLVLAHVFFHALPGQGTHAWCFALLGSCRA